MTSYSILITFLRAYSWPSDNLFALKTVLNAPSPIIFKFKISSSYEKLTEFVDNLKVVHFE